MGASSHIVHLIATYGVLAIGAIVALESMGLPLPGESVLALAALYAARTITRASLQSWRPRRRVPLSVTMSATSSCISSPAHPSSTPDSQVVGEAGTLRTFQGSSGWRPADKRA